MLKKFFILFVVGVISVHSLTIGTCLKYSSDGQKCSQCIPNYHLYEGECYVDIIGCVDYKFGNICHQCDKNYILVNNLCCDQICMNKLFSKFKTSSKKDVIANNTDILGQLIPYSQANYIKDSNARLIAIQFKEFNNIKRFFFLYEFYSTVSNFYSKRLVLDYVLSSKRIIPVDWSEVNNSWKFAVIQYTEVQKDAEVLTIYPQLYNIQNKYNEIIVRKAVCNLIEQYEIATKLNNFDSLRILYKFSGQNIILFEFSKTTTLLPPTIQTKPVIIGQNVVIPAVQQPLFVPYKKTYKGLEIEEALKTNQPLQAAIESAKAHQKFHHLLTLIQQQSSIKGIIGFEIIGEDKKTGSIIRFVLQFNIATRKVTIISVIEDFIAIQPLPQIQTTIVIPPVVTPPVVTPSVVVPVLNLVESKFDVVQQGCTSHSLYFEPLSKEMSENLNNIKIVLQNEIIASQNSENPMTKNPNLVFRRLVITEAAPGINWRQVAYVQHDPSNPNLEYFTYFIEKNTPVRQWFYMGMNTKMQSLQVFNKPQSYPIVESDPSFIVNPEAKFFHVEGVVGQFVNNLNQSDKELVGRLNPLNRTEIDRKFSKLTRFSIDMINKVDLKRYKAIGYKFLQSNSSIPTFASYININNITDSNTPTTTEISTNILGQETIKTDNVGKLLKDDAILVMIIKMIESKNPIISDYVLIEVDITEYAQSLKYTLIFNNKNINNDINFKPSSQVVAVAIHDKNTHENKLISFELANLIQNKPTDNSGSTTTQTITPVQPLKPLINQADRIKTLIEDVIIQLQDLHKYVVPDMIDINQKIDIFTGTVILTFTFKDQNGNSVVVTATGDLKTDNPPLILQIKKVPKQIVQQMIVPPTPVNPIQTLTKPTQPSTSSLVSQPSPAVINNMQNEPYEQTKQVDGEIIKIKINPNVETLQPQLKAIACEINDMDQLLRKNSTIENASNIKFLSIQLAANSINIQYAIIIKSTLKDSVQIRRYFFVKQLNNNKVLFMGYQQLPAQFDVFKVENRFFRTLQSIQKSKLNQNGLTQTIVNGLNKIKSTSINTKNIQNFDFRTFPLGNYAKVGIVTQKYIGLAYILKQQSNIILLKWDVTQSLSSSKPTDQNTKPTDLNTSTLNPVNPSIIELNNQNKLPIDSSIVTIQLSLQQKLTEVLKYVSLKNNIDLIDASLESYQDKQNRNYQNKLQSIQFSLYFVRNINKNLIRQFFVTVIRSQNGDIKIISFEINDLQIKSTQPQATIPSGTSSQKAPVQLTISKQVVNKQQQTNQNLVIIDPNEILYAQAMQLVNKDSQRKSDDLSVDLKSSIPESLYGIVKYIRAKYVVVHQAKILYVVQALKTQSLQKYRIYFFKQIIQGSIPTYQIFKCVIQYQRQTRQTKFNVITFEIYVNNNQLTSIKDNSRQDDTDIAFGYSTLQLNLVPQDKNVQNVLKEINKKYKDILSAYKLSKVQFLQLKDGRLNYKILFTDSTNTLQSKFIVFYQPALQKVLVLNSVSLPNSAQYSQLSSSEQLNDRILSSVLAFVNEIHSEINGFSVKSVSKALVKTENQYNIIFEKKNKKYRSIVRVSQNNIDMTEIKFSELAEISLDHYKLDQFDQIFIMNYQKLSEQEMRTDSKFRMTLNYLYMNQKITKASLLGAATKSSGLGQIYKVYLRIDSTAELFVAQIYIEAFSNKISIKSYKSFDFENNLVSLSLQQTAVTKVINYLKEKNQFTQFTVKSAQIKDFLFGSLYKLTFVSASETFGVYVYHDHSTEQVTQLFNKVVRDQTDQCNYEGATCVSCKNTNYRVSENKCVQIISNCVIYAGNKCSECKIGSKLFNGVCVAQSQCGSLCQVVSI